MKILQLYGIEIKISYILIPILIFSVYLSYFYEMVVLIFIILIHELAHSFTAIYYGTKITEIELFPFGGIAKTEGYLELNPFKEVIIAIAGPMSNFILIGIMLIFMFYQKESRYWSSYFILSNLTIGIFNMLPIFPLDGGRILRGYITTKLGHKKATETVIKSSKVLCIVLFCIGIGLGIKSPEQFILSGIAIFLYKKTKIEKEKLAYAFVHQIINKKKHLLNKEIMEIKCLIALETTAVKKILYEFVFYKYHFITVINNKGEIVAQLTENEILEAIIEYGYNITLNTIIKK